MRPVISRGRRHGPLMKSARTCSSCVCAARSSRTRRAQAPTEMAYRTKWASASPHTATRRSAAESLGGEDGGRAATPTGPPLMHRQVDESGVREP
jgi:hypothetical protein